MVLKCWNDISEELIRKSFLACGQSKDAKASDITCMKKGKKLDFLFEEIEKIFENPTLFEGTNIENELPDEFELESNEIVIYDEEICCVICEGLEKFEQDPPSPKNQSKAEALEEARMKADAAEAEAKAAEAEAKAAEAEAKAFAEAEEARAESEAKAEAVALQEADEKAAAERRALADAAHFRSINDSGPDPEVTFFNENYYLSC